MTAASMEETLDAALSTLAPERTNLLPALHRAQDLCGYLPAWAMEIVGKRLHVPASEVHGVASGYTEFRFAPPPAGFIQICTGLSCRLAGADALLARARAEPRAAVETVPCLFLCSLAPVALAGDELVGRASVERLERDQETHGSDR